MPEWLRNLLDCLEIYGSIGLVLACLIIVHALWELLAGRRRTVPPLGSMITLVVVSVITWPVCVWWFLWGRHRR